MLDGGLPAVSGILLAGGRSSRFGRSKLEATIAGRSLFELALESLAFAVDEIVVCVGPDQRPPRIPESLRVPARVSRDPIAFDGPLAGLLAGLEASFGSRALAVAADMPFVSPPLLARVVDGLARRDIDAVALSDGSIAQPLPIAVRVATAIPAARGLRDAGETSIRSLFAVLRMLVVEEPAWRDADPDGAWMRDIDRVEDLPPGPT